VSPADVPRPVRAGALLLLLAGACSRGDQAIGPRGPWPTPETRPVLTERLAEYAEEGLPTVDEDQVAEVQDLLLLSRESGRNGSRAIERLAEMEPRFVASAALTLVETHNMDLETRTAAYGWMRIDGPVAMLPRLTLRLKYEKDWPSNVDIARALLKHGNGAGLDALVAILQAEPSDERVELARYLAMEALGDLPRPSGADDGFEASWERLLQAQSTWARWRSLPLQEERAPRALRAEWWRMLARFRSQPLRPVDDARYVLVRASRSVFPLLQETAFDEDRYVREHALQAMEWIGYPIGRAALDRLPQVMEPLLTLRGDPPLRPRLFGALGAMGLPGAGEPLLPWLRDGNPEESTAAADALLRCADEDLMRQLEAAVAADRDSWSPEAQYAIDLLVAVLGEEDPAAVPVAEGLDDSERQRRLDWARHRVERPQG
jgi:HEAT repeat protein